MRFSERFPGLDAYAAYADACRSTKSRSKRLLYTFSYLLIIPMLKLLHRIIFLLSPTGEKKSCDVLVHGSCRADIDGSLSVWEHLKKKGLRVSFFYLRNKLDWVRCALKAKPERGIPSRHYLDYHFARYLADNWKPAVLCTFHSYDVLPTFLRHFMKAYGKSVYMPHAIIPDTYLYTSLDYDYYFVFGKTSAENLKRQKVLYGSTRLVRTGSPRITPAYELPEATPDRTVLFFSNWMIGRSEAFARDFEIVRNWAAQHPEYRLLVKLHPLEDPSYVSHALSGLANAEILDQGISMPEAVSRASLVATAWSVASLEAALMKRPVVIANSRKYDPDAEDIPSSDKFLYFEKFFEPRANNADELMLRIESTLQNYPHYVKQAEAFARYHLEHFQDAPAIIAEYIRKIAEENDEAIPFIVFSGHSRPHVHADKTPLA
jgi:hypothetical protein